MKEIKAIIRPFKLSEVIDELSEIEGLPGVTVSEIKSFGKSKTSNAKDKVTCEEVELIPRIKLEVVVLDSMVERVVEAIQKIAHTGNTGDGKIFITDVEETIKIQTNERGISAI